MTFFSRHQDSSARIRLTLNRRTRVVLTLFVACVGTLINPNFAPAQLSQDVRDVFEGMMNELDPDLRKKFQQAIDQDTDKVEFTPDEFLRFRDNPANPFEGLERIKADPDGGNIALRFALPSLRDRSIDEHERQHKFQLARLSSPALTAASSTVTVFSNNRKIAMGIVVSNEGLIVTKASELKGRDKISCRLANGKIIAATKLEENQQHDLALLLIEAKNLTPISWSSAQPKLGSFLLSPSSDGSLLAMGSYSVRPRSTAEGEQAFLGVQPVTTPAGILLQDIRPGTASFEAGLRNGDVLLTLDAKKIETVQDLVMSIRSHRPGDKVNISFRRDGAVTQTEATLAGRQMSGERAARFKMMNRLGAVPSRRDGDFPSVFQHDTPLFPEQCGGPIVDLDGNVVGMNIARRGRAASFAIPADLMRELVDQMLKESVASLPKPR